MDKNKIDTDIQDFMHPTVYTGVKPLFLVAEELPIKDHVGGIIDAVWVHFDDESKGEFSYITKFAVRGKIIDRNYYSSEQVQAFKGRLALPNKNNLEKMMKHRDMNKDILEVKAKRNALADVVQKDFDNLDEVFKEGKEVFLFKKAHGDWLDPFYDINIEVPYSLAIGEDGVYILKHPKTGVSKKYTIGDEFYAYIVGEKSEISGLQLKDTSYKKMIVDMKDEERKVFESIEWLDLDDPRIKSLIEVLPRHPFDDYFKYVKKGDEYKVEVPQHLIEAVEGIILKHIPEIKGPMGIEYIPIDNLLYLFHEIIPRLVALRALEVCDIVHEPSALLLGFEGQRELPPKFLVSLRHVIHAYEKFPRFVEACENHLKDNETS